MAEVGDFEDQRAPAVYGLVGFVLLVAVALLIVLVFSPFAPEPNVQASSERDEILVGLPEPSATQDLPTREEQGCGWFGCEPGSHDVDRTRRDGYFGAEYERGVADQMEVEVLVRQRLADLGYTHVCDHSGTEWYNGDSGRGAVSLTLDEEMLAFGVLTTLDGAREVGSSDYTPRIQERMLDCG